MGNAGSCRLCLCWVLLLLVGCTVGYTHVGGARVEELYTIMINDDAMMM